MSNLGESLPDRFGYTVYHDRAHHVGRYHKPGQYQQDHDPRGEASTGLVDRSRLLRLTLDRSASSTTVTGLAGAGVASSGGSVSPGGCDSTVSTANATITFDTPSGC